VPLPDDTKKSVIDYCDQHLGDDKWFEDQFAFIADERLRERLAVEFYAARYVYKLGEGLAVGGARLHAHCKFQIVQYASIYEGVIVHLLWGVFANEPAVAEIDSHLAIKRAGAFPADINVGDREGRQVFLAVEKTERTPRQSIKFEDKVAAAVAIGLLDEKLGEEIKDIYTLRNAIHLETALKRSVDYGLEQSQLAYRRMRPFLEGVRARLAREPQPGMPAEIPPAD